MRRTESRSRSRKENRSIGKIIERQETVSVNIDINERLDAIPRDRLVALLREGSDERENK